MVLEYTTQPVNVVFCRCPLDQQSPLTTASPVTLEIRCCLSGGASKRRRRSGVQDVQWDSTTVLPEDGLVGLFVPELGHAPDES